MPLLLACAAGRVRCDAALLETAAERTRAQRFASPARGEAPADLTIRRADAPPAAGRLLSGSPAPWGSWWLEGRTVYGHIPDDAFAAEALIRIAWQLSTLEQGGLLFHSSSVMSGGRALVAVGKSGDGKSTLARLSREAGATVLSDEINQLFPDGTAWGTPFRSDPDMAGCPGGVPLKALVVLEKGDHEGFSDVSPTDFVQSAMAQCYMQPGAELPRPELNKRLLSILGAVPLKRLTFRKHPDAGRFVVDWLNAG